VLTETADVVLCFKEYPHVDVDRCAEQLADIVLSAIDGHVRPTMATFDCKMLGTFSTTNEPMAGFVSRMRGAERAEGVLAVSLAHGFVWGDSPFTGSRMVVVTDNDPLRASDLAESLGREFFSLRDQVALKPLAMMEGLDLALEQGPGRGKPVVIADCADNAGGGAPSDSTFLLEELLHRGVRDVALAMIWDPIAVALCSAAGEGATLELRLGGKASRASGRPLDVEATVRRIVPDLVQRWPQLWGAVDVPCGDAVHLEVSGIDVIVNSRREQVFGTEVFTAFGIDPSSRRVLVVKSMNHFRGAYDAIAALTLHVTSPGALQNDPRVIPYRHTDRHQWPWVEQPWTSLQM
jgi:microcystin degradation protein MlrC